MTFKDFLNESNGGKIKFTYANKIANDAKKLWDTEIVKPEFSTLASKKEFIEVVSLVADKYSDLYEAEVVNASILTHKQNRWITPQDIFQILVEVVVTKKPLHKDYKAKIPKEVFGFNFQGSMLRDLVKGKTIVRTLFDDTSSVDELIPLHLTIKQGKNFETIIKTHLDDITLENLYSKNILKNFAQNFKKSY